ncbi:putative peptidoglycan-binding domain-containing protein, partial [Alteromonas sp. 14N.309.X.WAT.G.H12]|uniref:putative peptidoglycan-binding domain-containing protein n=1 Tax=Alteromonas sp. 14N.309.X.WAT.G.H12 TaxID=3120824 RepID=UPI002FD097BF
IFDFAVNAGVSTAIKLTQDVAGVTTDGIVGSITLKAVNNMEESVFIREYALKKMARYANIVNNNPSQAKFLLGWINRSLKAIS